MENENSDDEFGEKTVSILLDGEESEMVFIDHPSIEMSVIWYWVYQIPVSMTEQFTTKTRNTIVDWNNLCRDVVVAMFNKRKKMSDPGQIVQIDESLFQGKRKYNRGRLRNGDIIPNVDDNVCM
ncbi:hypothetical protein QTP88_026730 [Uroleucon formosanum]